MQPPHLAPLFTGPDFRVDQDLMSVSWGILLQSSLVLSIFSLYNDKSSSRGKTSMPNLSLAFLFGTLGSIFSAFVGKMISIGKSKTAISCLTGSFIGGTVNFFELAGCLARSTEERKMLNLIAGADILVMIAYFAFMLASRSTLASILPPRRDAFARPWDYSISKQQYWKVSKRPKVTSSLKSLSLSLVITSIASCVQNRFPKVIGLAVPISTLLAVAVSRTPWLSAWVQPGTSIASFMLCLFYAIIGLDCRIQNMATLGLPVVSLMVTMLLTHFSAVVGLSALWNKTLARNGRAPVIGVDDALIASNVCIGGASTASAMAFSIGKLDLMIPASIFGVVGYLLGTPVGLWVHNKL